MFEHAHPVVCQHVLTVPAADLAVTIISVEEQLTGWYSALRRAKLPGQIAEAYNRFTQTVRFLSGRQILTYTEAAIQRCGGLVALKLKVGKMDLKIAAMRSLLNTTRSSLRETSVISGACRD